MTREEAIKVIRKMLACTDLSVRANLTADMIEACHVAIKALDQEPCEDAISRQAYIERYRTWGYSEYGRKIDNEELAIRVAMSLPPVTPQAKTMPKIPHNATNKQAFVYAFGLEAWKQMIEFSKVNEQFMEFWNAPYKAGEGSRNESTD